MADYQITLVDRAHIARGTMAFWFNTNNAKYEFQAGQHADFAFIDPPDGSERDNARTFSLAGSPHDKDLLMVAMRMRNSPFKNALNGAPIGTQFRVSRSRGAFTLHKNPARPAVFLAGGIGITPMLGILHWAAKEKLQHKLFLFYSNRDPEDVPFLEGLEDLAARNRRLTLIPTITRASSSAWAYERGPIDQTLLSQHLHVLNGPIYYIAGPSGMVTAMTGLLRSSGVSEDDIKTEEFGDYQSDQSQRS